MGRELTGIDVNRPLKKNTFSKRRRSTSNQRRTETSSLGSTTMPREEAALGRDQALLRLLLRGERAVVEVVVGCKGGC